MQQFVEFIFKLRNHLLFFFLSAISLTLLLNRNPYQGSSFFNSCNYVAAIVLNIQSRIKQYFNLAIENKFLLEENRKLREMLKTYEQYNNISFQALSDTLKIFQYRYYTAKVINNSTDKHANYFTIDRGASDGIKPGMGVISKDGVAGIIHSSSSHFSTVTSLLNDKWPIYAKIKSKGISGILKWDKQDPEYSYFDYVAKHHRLSLSDTIVTHTYSSFPEECPIGTITEIYDEGIKYKLKIRLFTNFRQLRYVYIIENKLKDEIDKLQSNTKYKK